MSTDRDKSDNMSVVSISVCLQQKYFRPIEKTRVFQQTHSSPDKTVQYI